MAKNADASALVILLHGRGGSGAGLLRVAAGWGAELPGARIEAPEGPMRSSEHGHGRQWFSVAGVSPENRSQRVMAARAGFNEAVSEVVELHGFADRLDRVVLFGFSQGAIMSLDALMSGRWPVAGVVAFAGRLVPTMPTEPSRTTRVCLIHGEADEVIPAGESVKAAEALRGLGVAAEVNLLSGLGHRISAEGSRVALGAISQMLYD